MTLTYEEFVARYGDDPKWAELRESPYFEVDLRRALNGNEKGFGELAVYGPRGLRPRIMRDLWKEGLPVRAYREFIKSDVDAGRIQKAFLDDLDAFLRDAGFSTARLPEAFDVWRGGSEPADVMARSRSWTRSYSAACAFALESKVWRDARRERWARAEGLPEPLVLIRHIRRDQAVAWLGGPEREVILAKTTTETPAQPYRCLSDWRRHRARVGKAFWN